MKTKKITGGKIFVHSMFILVAMLCVLPIVLVVVISITSQNEINAVGYSLFPKELSLVAYELIFKAPKQILTSYGVTIFVTVVGTALSVVITTMLGYAISRKDYAYAKITSFYVFFTMLFNGGIVPWYILIARELKLTDTILALILPNLVLAWFVILAKGFFSTMSMSIIESAKIDGASEFTTFFRIVMPLSKPGIATITLLIALMYWNDYYLSLMFIQTSPFVSLQLLLYRIMSNSNFMNSALALKSGIKVNMDLPSDSLRMAIAMVAAGPMMFVFPFFQKYFQKGMTLGAIKE